MADCSPILIHQFQFAIFRNTRCIRYDEHIEYGSLSVLNAQLYTEFGLKRKNCLKTISVAP
jgi:hypothetical protein